MFKKVLFDDFDSMLLSSLSKNTLSPCIPSVVGVRGIEGGEVDGQPWCSCDKLKS